MFNFVWSYKMIVDAVNMATRIIDLGMYISIRILIKLKLVCISVCKYARGQNLNLSNISDLMDAVCVCDWSGFEGPTKDS